MDRLVIKIPSPIDRNFGYLSTESLSSFNEGDRRWLSIEHFLLGMRFEGTAIGDEIGKAKNIQTARLVSKPKRTTEVDERGRITKRLVYSTGKKSIESESAIEKKYITRATRAKFDQNPTIKKRLIDTKTAHLEDPGDPTNFRGGVLMDLRDRYFREINDERKIVFPDHAVFVDLVDGEFTDEIKNIINGIIDIVWIIKGHEQVDRVYPEMFEDAFDNIGVSDLNIRGMTRWMKMMTGDWSRVVADMPKLYYIIKQIDPYLSTKGLIGYDNKDRAMTALRIAVFIKWAQYDATGTGAMVIDNIFNIVAEDVTIPARVRKYRSQSMPSSSRLTPPKDPIDKDQYGDVTIVTHPVDKTIKLVIADPHGVENYRPRIVRMGGKIIANNTIKFSIDRLEAVENMVYELITSVDIKYEFICKRWSRDKVAIFNDVVNLIDGPNATSMAIRVLRLVPHFTTGKGSGDSLGQSNLGLSRSPIPDSISYHFYPFEDRKSDIINMIAMGEKLGHIRKMIDRFAGWDRSADTPRAGGGALEPFGARTICDTAEYIWKVHGSDIKPRLQDIIACDPSTKAGSPSSNGADFENIKDGIGQIWSIVIIVPEEMRKPVIESIVAKIRKDVHRRDSIFPYFYNFLTEGNSRVSAILERSRFFRYGPGDDD